MTYEHLLDLEPSDHLQSFLVLDEDEELEDLASSSLNHLPINETNNVSRGQRKLNGKRIANHFDISAREASTRSAHRTDLI